MPQQSPVPFDRKEAEHLAVIFDDFAEIDERYSCLGAAKAERRVAEQLRAAIAHVDRLERKEEREKGKLLAALEHAWKGAGYTDSEIAEMKRRFG